MKSRAPPQRKVIIISYLTMRRWMSCSSPMIPDCAHDPQTPLAGDQIIAARRRFHLRRSVTGVSRGGPRRRPASGKACSGANTCPSPCWKGLWKKTACHKYSVSLGDRRAPVFQGTSPTSAPGHLLKFTWGNFEDWCWGFVGLSYAFGCPRVHISRW